MDGMVWDVYEYEYVDMDEAEEGKEVAIRAVEASFDGRPFLGMGMGMGWGKVEVEKEGGKKISKHHYLIHQLLLSSSIDCSIVTCHLSYACGVCARSHLAGLPFVI